VAARSRIWAARAIALAADGIQIFAIPVFFGGVASSLNAALDLLVGVALVLLLGWHLAFLPSFIAELVPMLDIFPTWTATVLFVTRGRGAAPRG